MSVDNLYDYSDSISEAQGLYTSFIAAYDLAFYNDTLTPYEGATGFAIWDAWAATTWYFKA